MSPTEALALARSLRVTLNDPDAAARVTPEQIESYMRRAGWKHDPTIPRSVSSHGMWWHSQDANMQTPRRCGDDCPEPGRPSTHYADDMIRAISAIARHESRSPVAVWLDLLAEDDASPDALNLDPKPDNTAFRP